MAAAQVAKKLKDKRQQRTIEGIFKKVSNIHCKTEIYICSGGCGKYIFIFLLRDNLVNLFKLLVPAIPIKLIDIFKIHYSWKTPLSIVK